MNQFEDGSKYPTSSVAYPQFLREAKISLQMSMSNVGGSDPYCLVSAIVTDK